MPFPVICNACFARLSVPERLAGKQIPCPKCRSMIIMPRMPLDAEVVECEELVPDEIEELIPDPVEKPAARPEIPRRSKKSATADTRPSRKKSRRRRPSKKGSFPVVPVLVSVGLVFLLVGTIFAAWLFLPRDPAAGSTATREHPLDEFLQPPDPVGQVGSVGGWEVIEQPEFSISHPRGGERTDIKFFPKGALVGKDLGSNGRSLILTTAQMDPSLSRLFETNPNAAYDQVFRLHPDLSRDAATPKSISANNGGMGIEITGTNRHQRQVVMRLIRHRGKLYTLQTTGMSADDPTVRTYFESFRLK